MNASFEALRRLAPVCALALTLGFGVSGDSQAADLGSAGRDRPNLLERIIEFFVGGEAEAATVTRPAAPKPFTYTQLDANDVDGAMRTASAMTGVPLSYMRATAQKESSGDPMAAAETSTARGLYQVVEGTWLELVSRYGAKYGLALEAAAITRDADGLPVVADAAERGRILDLRFDPRAAALMAAELAAENKRILENELGRLATDNDLYLAHFIGPTDAARLIRMAANSPGANAAAAFPKEAASNEGVFYAGGAPRSCAQVVARLALA